LIRELKRIRGRKSVASHQLTIPAPREREREIQQLSNGKIGERDILKGQDMHRQTIFTRIRGYTNSALELNSNNHCGSSTSGQAQCNSL
jgi:hypothetical protein